MYNVYAASVFASVWVCVRLCLRSYNASLGRFSQQSSKGDHRRHAGTVEEEEGGHTLEAHAILEVTQIERSFPLDVQYQTTEQPDHGTQRKKERCRSSALSNIVRDNQEKYNFILKEKTNN